MVRWSGGQVVRWSGGQYGIYGSHKVTGGAELTRIFAIFQDHPFIGIILALLASCNFGRSLIILKTKKAVYL